MRLLGGIYEEKEKREGARSHRALLDTQGIDSLENLLESGRILFPMTARASRYANLFHDLERLLAFQSLNHPAERGSKPANILVEREILRARFQAGTTKMDGHFFPEFSG
jgi:hypothetical protein